MPFDDIKQQGINVGIWKFGTDELVNVSGLYLLLQPNQNMSMRKPTLLLLNGIIQQWVSPNSRYFVMTSTIFDSFRLKTRAMRSWRSADDWP